MNLLMPLGLAALAAIPLIILFHMRHTTPPRRPVASLRFWEAANPRPAEERRLRRPPLTLPLLLQLAAVLLLALALARPVTAERLAALATELRAEPKHLILLLDGSTSMSAAVPSGETDTTQTQSRWETARAATLERLAALREGDVATVILMGTRPITLTATDSSSLISLRKRLATLPQPGGRANLDTALTLAGDLLLPSLERQVVVISDAAATVDPGVVAGIDAPVELLVAGGDPGSGERSNTAVIDIAARPSADGLGTIGVYGSVVNFGPEPITAPVVLQGDGLDIGRANVALAANGGTESLSWTLPPGISELTLRLDVADALPGDNTARLLLGGENQPSISPRILLVTDLPGALARALAAIENVELAIEPSDNLTAIAAGDYDLVVFDRTAPPPETVARLNSVSLWIAPPVGGPFETTGNVIDPRVTRVRAGDPLLEGVDLSGVTFGPTPVFVPLPGDEEIVGADEGPLLYRTEANGQPALVLTVDPETSNLPKRVAFPVLMANLIAELAPDGIPASLPLGEPLVYEPRAATTEVVVTTPAGDESLVNATSAGGTTSRSIVFADTGSPGVYTVQERDAAGESLGATRFVVNAGHPRESDLRLNPALETTLSTATGRDVTTTRSERFDLWPLLALVALALIALEWLAWLWPARRAAARRFSTGAAS